MIKTFDYAITSVKTRNPKSREHYIDYLNALTDDGVVSNVNFETTRGLHIHYILTTTYELKPHHLYKTKHGWNHKIVPIFNKAGWVRYSEKDINKATPEDDGTPTPPQSPNSSTVFNKNLFLSKAKV